MGCDGSIEGVVDGAMAHVRPVHLPSQVEVDGIATQPECLPTIPYFNMLNSVEK